MQADLLLCCSFLVPAAFLTTWLVINGAINMGCLRKQLLFVKHYKALISYIAYAANLIEPVHEISNNVVCATSKASDQPAHTRRLIRALASRLSIL